MSKNDLLGGSLWEQYSNKVAQRMDNPKHMGELTEADAEAKNAELIIADWGAESCGDAVRLFWLVDPKTQEIVDARFKSFGCGTAIASSDMMAELCIGKTVNEAVKITNVDVEKALRDDDETPAVPPQKMHCSVMAYDVIKKAASVYKGIDVEEFEKEEIVCECAHVSLNTIQEVINLNDLKTVEEITQYTKAGAFCKSCVRPGGHETRKYYLVDILKDTRAEMEKAQVRKMSEAKDFSSMNLIQKHRAVEQVLDEKVRKMLLADGGSVEVVDMRAKSGKIEVYIQYQGACMGCPSSTGGTLRAIESALQKNLDENISVIPV
ncbi:MAG: iron-sulfur cluster assembly scaffold protein [Spirochaetia bacterium]